MAGDTPRINAGLAYGKRHLAESPPVLVLPTDRPWPAVQHFLEANQRFTLSTGLSAGLRALSCREGVTPFVTLLAAFQVLLYRYTGQDDIVVGSPVADRHRAELKGLTGLFVNTLVLRTDLSGDPTFRELLRRVREVVLGAYARQDRPFAKLVEAWQPERELRRHPLFQVMFALQHAPMWALDLPDLTPSPPEGNAGTARFDLALSGVSADCLHGFERFILQNVLSFPSTWRVECPHTSVTAGGDHDTPHHRTRHLPCLRPIRGIARG